MLLGLFSVLTIVSFQNCGQSGEIGLQVSPEYAKLAANQPNSDIDSNLPVSNPNEDPASGPITPPTSPSLPPEVPKAPPAVPKDPHSPNAGTPSSPVDSSTAGANPASGPSDIDAVPGITMPPSSAKEDDSSTVSHGSIKHEDSDIDDDIDLSMDEPDMDIDENDGSIIRGHHISCAGLNKLVMGTSLFVKPSNLSSVENYKGSLKISNKDQVDISNFKGLLFLLNIKNVGKVSNVKSMLMSIDADHVGALSNVKALSLINTDKLDIIQNYRGVLCLGAANIDEIANYRGVLEITGNVKKISNFRGILKVKGNIEKLENFRGILSVDGDILSQSNVKVKMK